MINSVLNYSKTLNLIKKQNNHSIRKVLLLQITVHNISLLLAILLLIFGLSKIHSTSYIFKGTSFINSKKTKPAINQQ